MTTRSRRLHEIMECVQRTHFSFYLTAPHIPIVFRLPIACIKLYLPFCINSLHHICPLIPLTYYHEPHPLHPRPSPYTLFHPPTASKTKTPTPPPGISNSNISKPKTHYI